ncbi:MAG: BatD family protein [Bacteroidetes bacterium]|nr:BatD family protein [Bacteroidota bacterium]
MFRLIRILFCICCAGLDIFVCKAQDNQLTVKASLDRINIHDTIDVIYSFNSEGENFIPPNYEGFRLISGPMQQTSTKISYVNGKPVSKNSLTMAYTFAPVKTGAITISPACIKTKDKHKYCSQSLTIVVEETGERHPYIPTPGILTDTSWINEMAYSKTNRELFDDGIDTLLKYYADPKNNIDTNKPAKLQMQFEFATQKREEEFKAEVRSKGYIIKAVPKTEFDSILSIHKIAVVTTGKPIKENFTKLADDLIPVADTYDGKLAGYGVDKTK